MEIETFTLGPWQTNCYVVSQDDVCWIVDAGFEPSPMIEHVRERG